MKRDMDLVRQILFAMEEATRTEFTEDSPIKVNGYKRDDIAYHMKIMAQAGLLHADEAETSYEGIGIGDAKSTRKVIDKYYSLSWQGHEFLAAARENSRWEKAKSTMEKAGGILLPVLMQILTSYVKAELKLP